MFETIGRIFYSYSGYRWKWDIDFDITDTCTDSVSLARVSCFVRNRFRIDQLIADGKYGVYRTSDRKFSYSCGDIHRALRAITTNGRPERVNEFHLPVYVGRQIMFVRLVVRRQRSFFSKRRKAYRPFADISARGKKKKKQKTTVPTVWYITYIYIPIYYTRYSLFATEGVTKKGFYAPVSKKLYDSDAVYGKCEHVRRIFKTYTFGFGEFRSDLTAVYRVRTRRV